VSTLWAPLLVAALTCAAILIGAQWRSPRTLFLDHPNERSLHALPVPRIGGLAMAWGASAGLLAAFFLTPDLPWTSVMKWVIPIVILVALGAYDDWKGASVVVRLALQLALSIGAAVMLDMPWIHLWWMTLAIMWMSNLYNFMDGSDGLAGSMTLLGFGGLAWGAWQANAGGVMLIALLVIAAAIPFLMFNWPRAKVFMGDSGSVPLGFGAACLGLYGWSQNYWHLPFVLLCFWPFILDATFTLGRRLLRGEKVWQAHRSHLYQRLILSGLSHGRLLFWAWILMLVCVGCALLTAGSALHGFMLLVLLTACMLAAATIGLSSRREHVQP
jgi:UDP-GlcNAc:undecaprenyl-phosphate/decaprenyl-phosphate GlcNAc-1-phosphate transferase